MVNGAFKTISDKTRQSNQLTYVYMYRHTCTCMWDRIASLAKSTHKVTSPQQIHPCQLVSIDLLLINCFITGRQRIVRKV